MVSGVTMLPADFIPLTNSIDHPTFWNLNAVDMFHATPAVKAPICEWMYVRYVRDDHRPTRIIVLSEAPLSFMAIAPPARRLWDDTRSMVYPRASSWSDAAPHLTASPISRSVTREMRPPVVYTRLIFPRAGPAWMFATRRASAATGQIDPRPRLWCTTAPFVPFFVCAMHIVALSACNRAFLPALCGIRRPSVDQSRMSHSRKGIVRLLCRTRSAEVYSPTLRR